MAVSIETITYDPDAVLARWDSGGMLPDFFSALLLENAKINLVSRETSHADLSRLAAESLLPLGFFDHTVGNYLDIGSGGGFPSIPIVLSGIVTGGSRLVERTQKKARALSRMLLTLGRTAEVTPQTFEDVRFETSYDLITLRLVTLTPNLLRRIGVLLSPGGVFVYYAPAVVQSADWQVKTYRFCSLQLAVEKHFSLYRKIS